MTEKKTILIYTDVQQIGKTDRNLDGKNSIQHVLFHFSRSMGSIKIFSK